MTTPLSVTALRKDDHPIPAPVPPAREPVEPTPLRAGLHTPNRPGHSGGAHGRVISVLRSCGGAGATTIAVHLAACFAAQRVSTCLLDFDIQKGSCALALDMDAETGLLDLTAAPERLDAALLRNVLQPHRSGIHLLSAPSAVMPLHLLDPEIAVRIVGSVAGSFSIAIIDLPPVWTDWTHACLQVSDAIVLVTTPSVPGLRNCKRELDTLRQEGLGDIPVRLVCNRTSFGLLDGRERLRTAERSIGHAFDAVIPETAAVQEVLDAGSTLFDAGRARGVRRSISALAGILGEIPVRHHATRFPILNEA